MDRHVAGGELARICPGQWPKPTTRTPRAATTEGIYRHQVNESVSAGKAAMEEMFGSEAWWHGRPMPAHLHPITSIATEETIPSGEETFAGRIALSVAEVATALGVSRALVNQECASGRLHSVKIGQRRLIPVASLEAWLGIGYDDDGEPSHDPS